MGRASGLPERDLMRFDQKPPWATAAGYLAALMSGGIMGLTWVVQSRVLSLGVVGPAELNWLNMIGLCLIVWPMVLLRHRGRVVPRGTPVGWLVVFSLTAACIFYLRNVGVGLCGATTAAVVNRIEIALVFVLTYLVLHQRVRPWGWVGAAVLVAGTLRVAGVGSGGLAYNLIGLAALVVSAAGIATNALIITTHFHRVANERVILFSATIQVIVFSILVPAIAGAEGIQAALGNPYVLKLAGLGTLGIASNLFAYYYAMKRAPMWMVRILALVGPPTAMVADHFILGSPITAAGVQGLVAVLAGATVVILSGRGSSGPGRESLTPAGDAGA